MRIEKLLTAIKLIKMTKIYKLFCAVKNNKQKVKQTSHHGKVNIVGTSLEDY